MKRVIVTGFAIWLVATVALRVWGQHLFNATGAISIAVLFTFSALFMILLPRWLFRSTAPDSRATAAIALVAPGMLLDIFSTIWFPSVFPNIRPDAAALFTAWLLLCNVLVLISAASSGNAANPRTLGKV